ncbi:MAG: NAD(P)/FAD-dependent oxidoreductase [Thermosynechococcaceae cyanobacterium MS004]|nr:NAD(P)/FAD-dependent oxidoreductase [Thermosynechococcaceae cyanobacterium MS004]
MAQSNPSIVILGGGFGGLYTVLRLSQFPWPQGRPSITLVDQHSRFVFLPLLYELVTRELETWEIAPPFSSLLANTSIQFRQDRVERIDLAQQQVALHSGETLDYGYLVLALGGETPLDLVPGAAEYAVPFRSVDDAHRLTARLSQLETSAQESIRVVVAGAGPSGVELACKLADRLGDRGRIRLIDRNDSILKQSPSFNRTSAQKALDNRGIWIDLDTALKQVTADSVVLNYKGQDDTIGADLVLWTVGNAIAQPIQDLPVAHTAGGRIPTTATLQLAEYPHIFALGDVADSVDANQAQVPATAQAALQQSSCAAWNIWALINHRSLLPFRYTHLGEMLTLGTETAALAGLGVTLDGPLASVARRLVYLTRMPTLDHQVKVGLNWVVKPFLEALQPK